MKIKVIGRRYSDVATYYDWDKEKKWKNFEEVENQTWEIEAATLGEGEKWLAENHPDMYMGGNIICENGDFAMLAVPNGEYGVGNFETTAKRIAYVKSELEGGWIGRR